MRRLPAIVLFVVLAASMPLAAQRGGGRGPSGGHAGFSGHASFAGHSGGGHGLSGGRGFSGARSGSGFASRSFAHGRSFNRSSVNGPAVRGLQSRNFRHHRGLQIRTRGFNNHCFGYRCGWGYAYPWGYGAFDPYWWWDSGSSYDQDREREIGLANEMNAQSLDDQRARQQDDQDVYAKSGPAPQPEERSDSATVLVFRDQRKREIQNYAIVGQTLWNFSAQHTEKIPLTDLDLPATSKANDARGVVFRLPGADEGQ